MVCDENVYQIQSICCKNIKGDGGEGEVGGGWLVA